MKQDPGVEKLFHVHTYTDVDHAFWHQHLEGWVPGRVLDAHLHMADPSLEIETLTDELRRSHWSMELADMQDADTAARAAALIFPGRQFGAVAFGYPSLGWEVEGVNAYVAAESARRGWRALALIRPTWVAEQVARLLDHPSVIGVKPYYTLIGYERTTRDRYLEAGIFSFLPHHQLEVLNEREAWVTLHVPKAGRLGHPGNIADIRELRRRYPKVKLVVAHLGRSYTVPHAEEALPALADDPGIYFDTSAVLNPEVLHFALNLLGPARVLYGSDNPIMYLRGRQEWRARTYINRTNQPFYFRTAPGAPEPDAPEVEAEYTLYCYQALRALREACDRLGYAPGEVEAIFAGNAERLAATRQG